MSETVEGKEVRITFDGERCIHARACVLGLPQVFRAGVEGPWIHPDAATADEVLALARRCPSGAIQAARLAGGTEEAPAGRNSVAVWENGPYAARGALRIGAEPVQPRATLCRCGASQRKPYCDGSHASAGFQATGEHPLPEALPAWGDEGPLVITPLPDGPLRLEGSHEVTNGTGKAIRRSDRCFLCRCGQSANKPFCDGTHRKTGFTAPGA